MRESYDNFSFAINQALIINQSCFAISMIRVVCLVRFTLIFIDQSKSLDLGQLKEPHQSNLLCDIRLTMDHSVWWRNVGWMLGQCVWRTPSIEPALAKVSLMGVTRGDRKRWWMLIRVTEWEKGVTSTYCRASQKAVTAYFTSKQLLPFVYAWRHGSVIHWRNPLVNPLIIPTVITLNQSDNVNSHRELISGGPSSATQQTVILSSSLDNTWPTRVDPRGSSIVQGRLYPRGSPLFWRPACVKSYLEKMILIYSIVVPENTGRYTNVVIMLGQRGRRWPNIGPTMFHCHRLLRRGLILISSLEQRKLRLWVPYL